MRTCYHISELSEGMCIPEQILPGHTHAGHFCLGAQQCQFHMYPSITDTPMKQAPGAWEKAVIVSFRGKT